MLGDLCAKVNVNKSVYRMAILAIDSSEITRYIKSVKLQKCCAIFKTIFKFLA